MFAYTALLSSITAEDDWDRAMDMNREEFRDRVLLPPVAAEEDLEHTKETSVELLKRQVMSLTFLSRTTANEDVDRAEVMSKQPMGVYFDYALRQYVPVNSETIPYLRGWLHPASSLAPLAHAGLPLYSTPSNPFHGSGSMNNEHTRPIKSIADLQEDCVLFLAARIPLELLDIIVSYMANCVGMDRWGPILILIRTENSYGINDSYQPLRSCSFVCRRWANICRYSLFSGARLVFSSPEIWEEFVVYASRGCPSLVPIYKLIHEIHFIQQYQSPKPAFCYRIRDVPRGMLDHIHLRLDLLGPVPQTFPHGMLSTPHWSTPPTLTTPHSLLHPFHTINVTNVHMPSLLHVLKFIRYVAYTSSVYDPHSKVVEKGLYNPGDGSSGDGLHFDKLTWNSGKRQHYPFHFRSPYLSQLRPYDFQAFSHFFAEAIECTSNIRLCTYAAIAHPGCWMHWLPKAEQEWILALMESLEEPQAVVNFTCRECWVEMPEALQAFDRWQNKWGITIMRYSILCQEKGSRATNLTIYFEALPRNTTPKTSVRILGLRFEFDSFRASDTETFINIDALIQHLRKTSPERLSGDKIVILLSTHGHEELQALMKQYRPVILNPQTEEYDYVFAYNHASDSRCIAQAVDPVTLIPTGQSWDSASDDDVGVDIIASLCKIPLASDRKDEDEDDY